jgi:Uma2 family endonuclease
MVSRLATPESTSPPVQLPDIELPTEDGEPLESSWHRAAINLLIDALDQHWRDRTDYYAGGNMFIYYSLEQARNRDYRGPDFFAVLDVDGSNPRDAWVVWEEDGRYPNVIVELLSPSTAEVDRTTKKRLYEQTFRTPDYFCYDPGAQTLEGWRLREGRYELLAPNEAGRLWCQELGLWLGPWEGRYLGQQAIWLRFFTPDGELIATMGEAEAQRAEAEARRAEAEAQRAETEARRAQAAEAESERLRARLRAAGIDPDAD